MISQSGTIFQDFPEVLGNTDPALSTTRRVDIPSLALPALPTQTEGKAKNLILGDLESSNQNLSFQKSFLKLNFPPFMYFRTQFLNFLFFLIPHLSPPLSSSLHISPPLSTSLLVSPSLLLSPLCRFLYICAKHTVVLP